MDTAQHVVDLLAKNFINPLLLLIFAVGLLVFVYGVFEFVLSYNNVSYFNLEDKRGSGKEHMLWGLIGMFIMVSALTIVHIVRDTFPRPSPVEDPNASRLF